MDAQPFCVTDPGTWLTRGRSADHARALARIWAEFPDLPPSAAAEDRMARIRERACAMRPLNEEIQAKSERERPARNFAFIEAKSPGPIDARDLAILRFRDVHGYDWDEALRYADG